jgi:hypothetical protein
MVNPRLGLPGKEKRNRKKQVTEEMSKAAAWAEQFEKPKSAVTGLGILSLAHSLIT